MSKLKDNFVAKYSNKFNKAAIHRDKKNDYKRENLTVEDALMDYDTEEETHQYDIKLAMVIEQELTNLIDSLEQSPQYPKYIEVKYKDDSLNENDYFKLWLEELRIIRKKFSDYIENYQGVKTRNKYYSIYNPFTERFIEAYPYLRI